MSCLNSVRKRIDLTPYRLRKKLQLQNDAKFNTCIQHLTILKKCRKGQYDVLLWNGYRNLIRRGLLLPDFKASRDYSNGTWHGSALIPVSYLPPCVTKMNAYALHTDNNSMRVLESLYPMPFESAKYPDL